MKRLLLFLLKIYKKYISPIFDFIGIKCKYYPTCSEYMRQAIEKYGALKGTVLGTNNIWGYKKEKGKLIIDEMEAPLIRTIFNTYANNQKIGLKKLSIELAKQGYYNRNGNVLHQNTLKKIIQNPKYKGYY